MESYVVIIFRVRKQLKEAFGITQKDIWLNKEFKAEYGLDSIDIAEMVMWAEDEFSVDIPYAEIEKYEPLTVRTFAQMVMEIGRGS